MRRRRLLSAAVLGVLLGGAVTVAATASGSCSEPGYDDRCERRAVWATTRMGAIWSPQYSPSTNTVVAAGSEDGTIFARGFDARTGRPRWSFAYDDRVHVSGIGKDVTLSRDGRIAFVTGLSRTSDTYYDWATFALSARTGRLLWKKRYGGEGPDVPWQVVADPRRDAVYVAGEITKKGGGQAVVAYDARTGRRLWKRERGNERHDYDIREIRLRGRDLYVLELSSCYTEGCEGAQMLTRGTPSRSGFRPVWTARLPDRDADGASIGYSLGTVEASATRAFVVGDRSVQSDTAFVVQALRRRSGELVWTAVMDVDGSTPVTFPIAGVDEFRHQLIVGDSYSYSRPRIAAYDGRDGRLLWERRFTRHDAFEAALGDVGADRHAVYATGSTRDETHQDAVTTVALAPETGRQRWIARYDPAGNDGALGYLRFRGGRVFVPFEGFHETKPSFWFGLATYRP